MAICEDDARQVAEVKNVIKKVLEKAEAEKVCIQLEHEIFQKGEDLIDSGKQFDIIIQDVNLGDGEMSGYEVAKWVNVNYEIPPKILLLTSLSNQSEASHDYGVNAFTFIKKGSESEGKLAIGILRAIREIVKVKKVNVHVTGVGDITFYCNEIRYISKLSNDTVIHTASGDSFSTAKTLDDWSKILPPSQFLLMHRSNYVNLDFVDKFSENKNEVILKKALKGEKVRSVRANYKEYKRKLMIYERDKARGRI